MGGDADDQLTMIKSENVFMVKSYLFFLGAQNRTDSLLSESTRLNSAIDCREMGALHLVRLSCPSRICVVSNDLYNGCVNVRISLLASIFCAEMELSLIRPLAS